VHFWVRNNNNRLSRLTENLLRTFSEFHRRFPASKYYPFASAVSAPLNRGIGTTDEYFTHTYQVPSWTLEIEPANGGVDYGGFGRNGHDGFILPESQIERVRTELAQTFAIAYYRQAGPPSITALHVTDAATGAVVVEAEWDAASATSGSFIPSRPSRCSSAATTGSGSPGTSRCAGGPTARSACCRGSRRSR
jgi:hypothetical protein